MKTTSLFFSFLFILIVFQSKSCLGQTDNNEDTEIIANSDNEKYKKHIFYVDRISYEIGNENGQEFSTKYVLLGKGTCNIPNESPAERVNLCFTTNDKSLKPYYDPKSKVIYIFYPEEQFEKIQNLLLNSEKIWAQFFYHGKNNSRAYGDVHGRLNHQLENTEDYNIRHI